MLTVADCTLDGGVIGAVKWSVENHGYEIRSRFLDLGDEHCLLAWSSKDENDSTIAELPLDQLEFGEGDAPGGGEDVQGDLVMPGLIELHTDHLEAHYVPRPKVFWDPVAAVVSYDGQLATSGITTVLDSLRVWREEGAEDVDGQAGILAEAISAARDARLLRAEHFLHLRCEIPMVGDDGRGVLRKLVSRAGEPFVRQAVGAAMRLMGQVFVMGRTIDEAIKRMDTPENNGFTASFDMLGEAARTSADAERYFEAYQGAIAAVGAIPARGHSVSVKLSALHPRYETAKVATCVPELSAMLIDLARQSAAAGVQLTVDAEEAARLEMSLDIIEAAARDPQLKGWDGLGMAVQAYSKRARPVLAWADALGRDTGRIMQVRLVKGAYWDSEIKWAQERGLSDYPLFTRKPSTDVSYLACAKDMLRAANIRPAFATHNALTVATILEWAGQTRDFDFG